jgi:hypothetical protein
MILIFEGEWLPIEEKPYTDESDLAGCIVGLVERGKIINGSRVGLGDALIGLASHGLQTKEVANPALGRPRIIQTHKSGKAMVQ